MELGSPDWRIGGPRWLIRVVLTTTPRIQATGIPDNMLKAHWRALKSPLLKHLAIRARRPRHRYSNWPTQTSRNTSKNLVNLTIIIFRTRINSTLITSTIRTNSTLIMSKINTNLKLVTSQSQIKHPLVMCISLIRATTIDSRKALIPCRHNT